MNDAAFAKKGFYISNDTTLLDVDMIYNYLDTQSYWAKGIPRDRLERAIANSICFGIYVEKKQVGFARVTTDKATFAYIGDVFVLDAYRGQGLSKWLMQTILAHPDLQGLRRWSLATADAHGLYRQFGFSPITKTERWMEIFSPYPTKQTEEN